MDNKRHHTTLTKLFACTMLVGLMAIGSANAQTTHVVVHGSVFGGGNEATVSGNTEVLMQDNATVKTDVYGGGAFASTGTNSNNTTIVTIEGGTVGDADYGTDGKGNVFGGALGDANNHPSVNGAVTVNIGTSTQDANNVVIKGNIFGCNNAAGTPKDSVRVHIYHTAHTPANEVGSYATMAAFTTYVNTAAAHDPSAFALQAVYGGGNKADYTPASGKGTRVYIHNCDNTVKMVYGGGRAAAVGTNSVNATTSITVDGGRIDTLFAGGDGHTTSDGLPKHAGNTYLAADINGNVSAWVRCGYYSAVFGASNTSGTISGTKSVIIDKSGPCANAGNDEFIVSLFGGGNKADISGDVDLTIACGAGEFDEVYGGSNLANISGSVTLNIAGGTFHNVFGGSKGVAAGDSEYPSGKAANIGGNVTLNLQGGTMVNAFGGSNINGNIGGKIKVNVDDQNATGCGLQVDYIYGGGNLTAYTPNDSIAEGHVKPISPIVNFKHLTSSRTVTYDVYGGGYGTTATVTANPKVIIGGTTSSHYAKVGRDVYGGGAQAPVVGATQVIVRGNASTNTSIASDVYGGGALATVSGSTQVDVLCGNVTGSVYGGGLGQASPAIAANVGATLVNIGATDATVANDVVIGGNVYGANYINGSPAGNSEVHIYSLKAPVNPATYSLANVFGGGNVANYVPTANGAKAIVEVHNCFNKIQNVYGGGNAATVPETQVTINGGTIANVYGGGYGASAPAHVGYKTTSVVPASATASDNNGTGNTSVTIKGGTITNVFGGNNSDGTVRGTATVNIAKDVSCAMDITNVYGGGNVAPCTNTDVNISCTGSEPIDYVFGGANAAPVTGNIALDITGGKIGSAFGGNNASGAISGTVTVTVEWDGDCDDESLGYVYGGGQNAAYSGSPTVYIYNGTVTHDVFGGGYGGGATVGGSTVTVGDLRSGHDAYAAVVGGAVYGAGFNGAVTGSSTGNTSITIQKSNTQVDGVFGAGSNAGVSGNTTITMTGGTVNGGTIDASSVTCGIYGGSNATGTVGGNVLMYIYGGTVGASGDGNSANIHGGGYGSPTRVTGNVDITLGNNTTSPTVYGNVYGGSALGNVNNSTSNHTNVTLTDGTINGSIYGGGLGDNSNAALVNGNVAVAVASGTVTGGVFGCNDQNGTPKGTVTVSVTGSDDVANAINAVYGGGNLAHYDPTTPANGYPTVSVSGCDTKVGSVFGGGNAAAVPQASVTINGGIIGNAYAGGNGTDGAAHVGYKNKDNNPSSNSYGNGTASITVHGGTITNVFGGSNANGAIRASNSVSINKTGSCDMQLTNVYGGGNLANGRAGSISVGCTGGNSEYITNLFGGANQANVTNDISLEITGGRIDNLYGGNNTRGTVSGNITIEATWSGSGSCGYNYLGYVYGGGYGNETRTTGDVTVTIDGATVSHDVYGGSALGQVNDAPGDATTVNILSGSVLGNVYGGGLGQAGQATYGQVNGEVTVNIGATDGASTPTYTGSATIGGMVFGGNNTNGSPKADINVNVYKMGHSGSNIYPANAAAAAPETSVLDGDDVRALIYNGNTVNDAKFALAAVYGGGNLAPYTTDMVGASTYVTIYGCDNTIKYVYGGGKAADTKANSVTIKGGLIYQVYGGGDGSAVGTQANVDGDASVVIDGGLIDGVFGGSNTRGMVNGTATVTVSSTATCDRVVNETFGGGNQAPGGSVLVTIPCGTTGLTDVYGGAKNADIGAPNNRKNIVLTIEGGDAQRIFGGNMSGGTIYGDVTVNVYGTNPSHTIDEVFGGSNLGGNIVGNIVVNIDSTNNSTCCGGCPLKLNNVYGGGNLVAYVPDSTWKEGTSHSDPKDSVWSDPTRLSPQVNIINATVRQNVFGGGKGYQDLMPMVPANKPKTQAEWTAAGHSEYWTSQQAYDDSMAVYTTYQTYLNSVNAAKVMANPVVTVGTISREDGSGANPNARVGYVDGSGVHPGNVYGGGNAAPVVGNTKVVIQGNRTDIMGSVYGGGNAAKVTGNTTVEIGDHN